MELEFSSQQTQVASIFKQYRNTIDIYTEDEEKDRAFYKILLGRLLEDTSVVINDIYPLGCSNNVISACKNDTTQRKRLYIVDGDIYLLYAPKNKIPNLFVLDAYCIENLIVDEDAVCNTISCFLGTMLPEDVKSLFKYNFLIKQSLPIIDLFYYLAIQQEYIGRFTLESYAKYCDNKKQLDLNLLQQEIDNLSQKIVPAKLPSYEALNAKVNQMSKVFPKTVDTFMKVVSGKDYIIKIIAFQAMSVFKGLKGLRNEVWKYNLARYCKLDRLDALKQAIIAASC